MGRLINLCQHISTSNLKGTSDLIYAAAKVVSETLGFSSCDQKTPQKPPWKWHLQNNLTSLHHGLMALESGHLKAQGIIDSL